MIEGIGNDIIEVKRIEQVIARFHSRFLDKVFTKNEQEYCLGFRDSGRRFAGRFAAKEAVVKSIGTGFREGISWLDIEVISGENGKPVCLLSPSLKQRFPDANILVSISHCREYATAFAICLS